MSQPTRCGGRRSGDARRVAGAALPLHRQVVLALNVPGSRIPPYARTNPPRRSNNNVVQGAEASADSVRGFSESDIEEHEQKASRYHAELSAYLKAKYFSNKAFDGGKIFEEETIVQGETIHSSRRPCTSSYVNPVLLDKNHDKRDFPSSAADSSAKNDSPSVVAEASPKNNAIVLATENNFTPGKRHTSKGT